MHRSFILQVRGIVLCNYGNFFLATTYYIAQVDHVHRLLLAQAPKKCQEQTSKLIYSGERATLDCVMGDCAFHLVIEQLVAHINHKICITHYRQQISIVDSWSSVMQKKRFMQVMIRDFSSPTFECDVNIEVESGVRENTLCTHHPSLVQHGILGSGEALAAKYRTVKN